MTDRERAIVMAYTNTVTLTGEKLAVFYEYLAEKFGRPVYSHEIPGLYPEIKRKAEPDFIAICTEGEDRMAEKVKYKYVFRCSTGAWRVVLHDTRKGDAEAAARKTARIVAKDEGADEVVCVWMGPVDEKIPAEIKEAMNA